MTPARALGAVAVVVTVVQCAVIWQGVIGVTAVALLVIASREESGR